jgi:hypothetical protein
MGKEDGFKEWRDSLKSVLKKTSQTTNHNVLFLYDSQMSDERFVEDINCILYCGEVRFYWLFSSTVFFTK